MFHNHIGCRKLQCKQLRTKRLQNNEKILHCISTCAPSRRLRNLVMLPCGACVRGEVKSL